VELPVKHVARRSVVSALSKPAIAAASLRFAGGRVVIFMLHRVHAGNSAHGGHHLAGLRGLLSLLRRARVTTLALDEFVAGLGEQPPRTWQGSQPAVIFTVDDGYADTMVDGVPVFREFDVPVTIFVAPGIIDAADWFWWDQVSWLVARQERASLSLRLPGDRIDASWRSAAERETVVHRLVERLKRGTPADRQECLRQLEWTSTDALPAQAPVEHAVASWEALRAAESDLVRFGAHTMRHPILSGCTDDESRLEIEQSVQRVRQELRRPSAVFCYPNGTRTDFGSREERVVRELGLLGAVSTEPGTIERPSAASRDRMLWRLPRIGLADDPGENVLAMLRGG
jgi:peptidoglycan/xylan/chitin deacetylase (PgdA/CDA1 family)